MTLSIGIAVITHTAKHHLKHCLPPLLSSPLQPRVLVVNSSSQDGTVEEAESLGADTMVIPRDEFNHGTTRERARQELGTDIVVMVTPDAYPVDNTLVEKLTAPIRAGAASIAYARQLPHQGAGFFESFPRWFNYPKESQIRSIEDIDKYGSYTFFCSDSSAAYLNSALDEIGGFPSVLIGEDTFVSAQLLQRGHKIAYVAEAETRHSHRYGLKQEFQRHYDTGLARKQWKELIAVAGRDERRGMQFVKQMFRELLRSYPYLLPYATLQTMVKWMGYRLGRATVNFPVWFRRTFSGQDFYWVSKDFKASRGSS